MNHQNKSEMWVVRYLAKIIDLIALTLCVLLIVIAGYITAVAFSHLFVDKAPTLAITDALFVVILLELFYAVRSFIKRGSMNVGVIVNIGVISAVKEMIFKIDNLHLQSAISFGVIFVSLGILYVLEVIHYEKKRDNISEGQNSH